MDLNIFNGYNLLLVISEKSDDSMRRKPCGNKHLDNLYRRNREAFFLKSGVDKDNVVSTFLNHGNNVSTVGPVEAGTAIPNTDGLVTNQPGIVLAVTAADCPPVFFYDPKKKTIGLAHTGWQGLRAGIMESMFEKFRHFGSSPEDLVVAAGPGICAEHYPVSAERASQFRKYPPAIHARDRRITLDLKAVIALKCKAAGVRTGNFQASNECTFEMPNYFSFRRDKPATSQVMAVLFGMT